MTYSDVFKIGAEIKNSQVLEKYFGWLWAQHVKRLHETITFADKRKLLLVIEIQEALWRKLNNLKAPDLTATKSVKFATEGD